MTVFDLFSLSLITPFMIAAPMNNSNIQISINQPRGDRIMTSHSVDLLLTKLPQHARLAHQLPGLTNNLLSIAVLWNAGCKAFFHKMGCNITLDGEVILWGWRDPQNRLWCIIIVNDGWTTKLTLRDDTTTPHIPLSTPQTTEIKTTINQKSVEHQANSFMNVLILHN